jgi:hypothetical protein
MGLQCLPVSHWPAAVILDFSITDAGYNSDAAELARAHVLAKVGSLSAAHSTLCTLGGPPSPSPGADVLTTISVALV